MKHSLLQLVVFFALFAHAGSLSGANARISRGMIAQESGYDLRVVAEGLFLPWAVAWLPDGSAIITEKRGTLRVLREGSLSDPIEFPVPVTSGGEGGITRGQGGLMDVAVAPDFEETGWLYFTYSTGDPSANRTEIGRARWDGSSLPEFEVLWRNPDDKSSGQHFGARLLFLPDGTFLATIGDGGNPPVMFDGDEIRKQAQNRTTAFGTVIRLNPDGSIPEDNPRFDGDTLPGLWSYGHRNIQGIARNPESGVIWANEHGAAAGDELNRLMPGQNYGWPAATFSRNYRDGSLISERTELPGAVHPRVVWLDTHAPSGLTVYHGSEFPAWRGAVLSGGLVTRDIRVIRGGESNRRPGESRIPIGERVRDVRQSPDGGLYVLTDSENGQLLRIIPSS